MPFNEATTDFEIKDAIAKTRVYLATVERMMEVLPEPFDNYTLEAQNTNSLRGGCGWLARQGEQNWRQVMLLCKQVFDEHRPHQGRRHWWW